MEELRKKEELKKLKLKENIGVNNVKSRFLEEPSKVVLIEEEKQVKKEQKRGSSVAPSFDK